MVDGHQAVCILAISVDEIFAAVAPTLAVARRLLGGWLLNQQVGGMAIGVEGSDVKHGDALHV